MGIAGVWPAGITSARTTGTSANGA